MYVAIRHPCVHSACVICYYYASAFHHCDLALPPGSQRTMIAFVLYRNNRHMRCQHSLVPRLSLSFFSLFRARILYAKNRRRGRAWYGTPPTRGHLGQAGHGGHVHAQLLTMLLLRCLVDSDNFAGGSRRLQCGSVRNKTKTSLKYKVAIQYGYHACLDKACQQNGTNKRLL